MGYWVVRLDRYRTAVVALVGLSELVAAGPVCWLFAAALLAKFVVRFVVLR